MLKWDKLHLVDEVVRLRELLQAEIEKTETLITEQHSTKFDFDCLQEEFIKLQDRERTLTDRLLDRHFGPSSSPKSDGQNLKNIGSKRGMWGPRQAEYERVKREQAREADRKQEYWSRKIPDIEADINPKAEGTQETT